MVLSIDSAEAAKAAANAALAANATTRAQINASLIIPYEPDTKIKVGADGVFLSNLISKMLGRHWREMFMSTSA